MHQEDPWKTTFQTMFGLIDGLVRPFGPKDTSATLMRLINDMVRPLLQTFVIIYLDDILVFNCSWEEHMQHVRQVLQLLQQHKLHVTTLKLVFRQQYMNYLGFVADQEGIPPNPTKVQASA